MIVSKIRRRRRRHVTTGWIDQPSPFLSAMPGYSELMEANRKLLQRRDRLYAAREAALSACEPILDPDNKGRFLEEPKHIRQPLVSVLEKILDEKGRSRRQS